MDRYYARHYHAKRFRPQLGLDPPTPTRIYHFTPFANLSGILEARMLICNNDCCTQRISAANEGVQDRRSRKVVPCKPGGNLHDYVPFYFCFRSPMLGAISSGRVPTYTGSQEELVYMVSSVQRVAEAGLDFVFTDRHAVYKYAAFLTNLDDLREIDWRLILATWWTNILPEYPDRIERKQAEFLAHRCFPWDLVGFLAVMTPLMKRRVEDLLAEYPSSVRRPVRIEQDWYYQ